MATTKSTTPRSRSTSGTATKRATTSKSRASKTKADDSIVARTERTIKERPYTSAAIATGAVTAVAAVAAAAAGAIYLSRRDKSFKEASDELTTRVKGSFSDASEKIKDLSQRGASYLKGDDAGTERSATSGRTQQEIAEEALTLKQTGASKSPVDELSASEIKTGAVAY